MRWLPVYAVTALVTGLHNIYGIMNVVNGAPISLLNCLSLLGSATLLGAAFLLPYRRSVATKVAFAGSILSWIFYGPLVVAALIAPFPVWLDIRTSIIFRAYVPLRGMLLGPILLVAWTAHTIFSFRRRDEHGVRAQID